MVKALKKVFLGKSLGSLLLQTRGIILDLHPVNIPGVIAEMTLIVDYLILRISGMLR